MAPKTKDDVITYIKRMGTLDGSSYLCKYTQTESNGYFEAKLGYNTSDSQFYVGSFLRPTSTGASTSFSMNADFAWGDLASGSNSISGCYSYSSSVIKCNTDFYFHDCTFYSDGELSTAQARISSNPLGLSNSKLQELMGLLMDQYNLAITVWDNKLQSAGLIALR